MHAAVANAVDTEFVVGFKLDHGLDVERGLQFLENFGRQREVDEHYVLGAGGQVGLARDDVG